MPGKVENVRVVDEKAVREAIARKCDSSLERRAEQYDGTAILLLAQCLAPHDPEGALRNEWVNARGAIARFDRMAIEIRVLDVQETPVMDVAYAALIVEVLKLLCAEQWLDGAGMNRWRTEELGKLLMLAARQGEGAGIGDKQYLAAFGLRSSGTGLKALWEHLIEAVSSRGSLPADTGRLLEHYLRHGTLATRIGKAVGLFPTRAKLASVYEELCEALGDSRPFAPPPL